MKSIVLKTALKTLLIVISCLLVAFGVLSLGFPQHMATFCESTGNYAVAAQYASLRYQYTGNVDDLNRCMQNAILAQNDARIIEFGKKLTEHKNFDALCAQKDEQFAQGEYNQYTLSYRQYIYGKYAVALAKTGKLKAATEAAVNGNGKQSFAKGNALATLTVWWVENWQTTKQNAPMLDYALKSVTLADNSPDLSYYQSICALLPNQ